MVPMFTCGLLRSNFSFAMFLYPLSNLTEALLFLRYSRPSNSRALAGGGSVIAALLSPQISTPFKVWSGGRDLNPQPSPWKSETLPLSYPRPAANPDANRDRRILIPGAWDRD